MGYGDVRIILREDDASPWGFSICIPMNAVPDAIFWKAATLAGLDMPCWSCWDGKLKWLECMMGDCRSPEGPYEPPQELLRPRRAL